MAKMGRPPGGTLYPNSAIIKESLTVWLKEGKTLMDFCRQDEMPSYGTIYDWLEVDKDFASDYAHARDIWHDAISEQCMKLADTDPLEVFDDFGNKRHDSGSIAWKKLQIETRLKLLSKWNPKKYGDKTTLVGDAEAPVVIEASFDIFGELLKNMTLKRQTGE